MRDKSPTNCDAQLPESNFKTRSRLLLCRLSASAYQRYRIKGIKSYQRYMQVPYLLILRYQV
ncbi:DUF6783 domain-containing protein [Robinsoniella sp. KNHs210]|uniref:DUF6783 domain-containing protein n=1 Tax=Robinsoniella sp. KNHs210 TaxID=1469950 RepID=UPI003FA6B10C